MKPVKNLVFAALLVFTIALNAFAGDIDQPGAPAPPPPRIVTTTDETVPVTSTDTQQTTVEAVDYIIFDVLAALLSVY
jgi:hypothetical protein